MDTMQVFNYGYRAIRTVEKDGRIWFVAKDVADVLGYSRARDAIATHCKGGVKTPLPSNSGEQETIIIPESDVYRLVLRSKMPSWIESLESKDFQERSSTWTR